jgi:cell division protease FtsH
MNAAPERPANGPQLPHRSEKTLWSVLSLLALLASIVFLAFLWHQVTPMAAISYTQLEQDLRSGLVDHVVVTDREIVAYLKTPDASGNQAVAANRVEPDLMDRLAHFNVAVTREYSSGWLSQLFAWIFPAVMLLGAWYLMSRGSGRAGAGLLSFGASHAKVLMEANTGVTFADVAGVDEAKEELQEVVDFLKDPHRYGRLGAHIPKGVLLVGPPGTGKTLLARALAGEAGVSFLSTNGAEFVEMFVGVGAARVRDLFERARQSAPAIIFIDELDALGRARGAYGLGGHDEKEQTLNQLLAEMDGFDPSVGVIILGATNRPEILDPALLRAGRFDRQVLVDRPDAKGRVDILRVHCRKVSLASDVDLHKIAAMTPGFAGADLANLVNEAALLATRRGAEAVALEDFAAAVERIVAGLEKKTRILSPRERKTVAYHEMGHALVALSLPDTDPVQKVSVIPRGISALGYTIQRPTEDRFLMDLGELENRLAVLLGGRAAELLVLGQPSTGAADDLAKATGLARAAVARYGMNRQLGLVAYEGERNAFLPNVPEPFEQRQYSEETAREIDCAVGELLETALATATTVLTRGRAVLEQGARELLEKETLGESDLERLRRALSAAAAASAERTVASAA